MVIDVRVECLDDRDNITKEEIEDILRQQGYWSVTVTPLPQVSVKDIWGILQNHGILQ